MCVCVCARVASVVMVGVLGSVVLNVLFLFLLRLN